MSLFDFFITNNRGSEWTSIYLHFKEKDIQLEKDFLGLTSKRMFKGFTWCNPLPWTYIQGMFLINLLYQKTITINFRKLTEKVIEYILQAFSSCRFKGIETSSLSFSKFSYSHSFFLIFLSFFFFSFLRPANIWDLLRVAPSF